MTNPNEREARELLARIRDLLFRADPGCLGDGVTPAGQPYPIRDEVMDAITRALTREQREGCVPDAGEPKFVLLGRDPQAPALIEAWAADRARYEPDSDKPAKALAIAEAMRAYKDAHPEQGLPARAVKPQPEASGAVEREADLFAAIAKVLIPFMRTSASVADATRGVLNVLPTPPAPVDVRLQAIADDLQEYADGCNADYLREIVQRIRLLSGQQAGVGGST